MTLIELLIFVVGIAIAAGVGIPLCAWCRSALAGMAGGHGATVIGVLVGIVGGLASTVFVYASCWGLIQAHYRIFPLRPRCKRGQCQSADFHWDDEDFQRYRQNPKASKGTVFVCKCGDKYLHRGRHFSELLSDGNTRPYMIHPPLWRRWHSETSPVVG